MKTDYTLSRREEKENQQREDIIYQTLNWTSVGIAVVLGTWLMWNFMLGLTN